MWYDKNDNSLHDGGFMIYCLILCAFLLLLLIIGRSRYENSHFQIKRYDCENEKIKSPVRLVFLSDLHENSFGKDNETLISAIRKEQPDCILLGGDLIIGKGKRVKTRKALAFLRQLGEIAPVLYSFGNHETRVKHTKAFGDYIHEVEKLDIHILNNEGIRLVLNGTEIYFYGLELPVSCYKKKTFCGEKNPFEDTKDKELKVLLAHTPNFFESYALWNPDYVFSGHNHGGIVRLPGIGGVISTEHKLFPAYSYGLYRKGRTEMVLSAGAGSHTIKLRLFNPAEIVAVQLQKEKKGRKNYGNSGEASGI